jgi:AcrR family transcriptional regulator
MSAIPARDRRAERHTATRREILDAAWDLVRADGLGSLAMRDLGVRVGMRAQSLYGYFPSKYAIYDAMFADGNRELLRRLTELVPAHDPVERLRGTLRVFLDFCVEDPERYQLLFQRTIPRFEPSPESYAPALDILDHVRPMLHECGIADARAFDVWTGVTAGLAAQQNANQPGGDRWVRLADEVTDMFLAHFRPAKHKGKR